MKFLMFDIGREQVECPEPEVTRAKELFSSWVEAGKMGSWYHFADRCGGIGILNVESLEELNEMVFSHPAAGYTTT